MVKIGAPATAEKLWMGSMWKAARSATDVSPRGVPTIALEKQTAEGAAVTILWCAPHGPQAYAKMATDMCVCVRVLETLRAPRCEQRGGRSKTPQYGPTKIRPRPRARATPDGLNAGN